MDINRILTSCTITPFVGDAKEINDKIFPLACIIMSSLSSTKFLSERAALQLGKFMRRQFATLIVEANARAF